MTLVWNVKSAGYFSTNTKSTLISRQGCDWSAIMDVPSARQEVASCPIPTPCAQVLIETGYSITLTKKIVPLLRFQHTAFVLFHFVNNDFITNRDFFVCAYLHPTICIQKNKTSCHEYIYWTPRKVNVFV